MKKLFLYPGQLMVTQESCEISTVLGSCVALVLIDEVSGIAGVNHYLLPYPGADEPATLRHGSLANPELLSKVLKAGASRRTLQAALFGGASMFANLAVGLEIGKENIRVGKEFITGNELKLFATETDGEVGRRLYVRNLPASIQVRSNITGKAVA